MQLLQDDQITLLKSGSYGITLLYLAQCYVPERNCFIYNQQLLNVDLLLSSVTPKSQQQAGLMLDDDERYFIQENLDFIRQIKQFNLSNTETAILSAIILFNSDNPNLTDQKCVYHNNQRFVELLRMDIENNRNHTSPSSLEKQQMLQQLLNLVSVNLRRLTHSHFELIKSFKLKNPAIEFPPLHRELFNVDYFVYCHQQQQQQQLQLQQQQQQQLQIQHQTQLPQTQMLAQANRFASAPIAASQTQPHNQYMLQHKLPTQIKHESSINANMSSPSPSSCSSSSSSSVSMNNSSTPSSSSTPPLVQTNGYTDQNGYHTYVNVNGLKASPTPPIASPTQQNKFYQSTSNAVAATSSPSSSSSSSSSSSTSSSSSSTSNSSSTYINTNSLDFVQTLDEVILNSCSSLNNVDAKAQNASPSSTSSSISPPSYASLSSTYASLIKSEPNLYSSSNAMSIGIE